MPVKINGASSGSVTLAAPSSGSDVTLTLPTTALATTASVNTAVAPMGLVAVAPTSIANSGGSASLSNYTVSFSGVSSVSLNGVFSGDYDNYRIMWRMTAASSANTDIGMRLRASGSDNTAANYGTQKLASFSATASADNNPNGNTVWNVGYVASANGDYQATTMDIFAPFDTKKTLMTALRQDYSSTTMFLQIVSGFNNQSTAYDGFTLYPVAGGTLTGSVSVFGYKK